MRHRSLRAAAVLLGAAVLSWSFVPRGPATVCAAVCDAVYDADGVALRQVPHPDAPPNLVLVVVDTLRADALASGRMPFLASLAKEGVSFTEASAPSSWTLPSLTSLLTGLDPGTHGALDSQATPALASAFTTYAEVLSRSYGYETAAFVNSPWLEGRDSALQGFEHRAGGFSLQATEAVVGPWARSRDGAKPFFLLLHTFDVHEPYGAANHPWPQRSWSTSRDVERRTASLQEPWEMVRAFYLDAPVRSRLVRSATRQQAILEYVNEGFAAKPRPELAAELRDAYYGGAAWADEQLARSVGALRKAGLLENSVLVVVGDHGEAFGEHGIIGHGRQLYDELVRVPMVMHGPGPFRGRGDVAGGVGLVDVLPTFFEYAGLPAPRQQGTAGTSALALLAGKSPGRPVIAEEILNSSNTGRDAYGIRVSVRTPSLKYVLTLQRTTGELKEELYDLVADPGEAHDLGGFARQAASGLEPGFCDAVEAVRARIDQIGDEDRLRAGTAYGARLTAARDLPRTPCSQP